MNDHSLPNRPHGVTPSRVGVNQSVSAQHNARLVLTILREAGALPGNVIATRTGLSAQTVSTISARLEAAGLVRRTAALRGRVGKPRVPLALDPDGSCAMGLKVGRRNVELAVVDLCGAIRARRQTLWSAPSPARLEVFLEDAVPDALDGARRAGLDVSRLCGVGVAMPWQVWAWNDGGMAIAHKAAWAEYDLEAALARRTHVPVWLRNDVTCAARAELAWGPARAERDWAYFHIDAFIGGGVVIDGRVRDGRQGNAGAFGSLSSRAGGAVTQLIDCASLPMKEPSDPSEAARWLDGAGAALAQAALDVCAVLDFEAVVIDGAFPATLRNRLADRVRDEIRSLDTRGLIVPTVTVGHLGADAPALGAAAVALEQAHFI